MKKRIIIITSIAVMVITLGIFIGNVIYSWYCASDIDSDSDGAYTNKYGYCERYCEYDYDDEEPVSTVGTFNANQISSNIKITMVPGEVVYYCVMFDVLASEVSSGKTYTITLNVTAAQSAAATSGNGEYEDFLANCTVEASECLLYSYTRAIVSDSYYSFTEGSKITISNTAISSFEVGENELSITIPSGTYEGFTDSESVNHSVFMLYIPIWYQDTEVNQNGEMCSIFTITKTQIN